jgi:hypothetical protein
MSTGSLKKLRLKQSIFTEHYEFDEVERQKWLNFYKSNHLNDYDCISLSEFADNINTKTKELCAEAEKFKVIKNKTKVISDEFWRFMVEAVLGFLIPSLIVLVGPRLVMTYIKWLTR